MGITSSTSFGNDQVQKPAEKVKKVVVDPSVDWPEEAQEALRGLNKEFSDMFESKEGGGDKETREKEAGERYCEFMRKGPCKEAYTAFEDCVEETGDISKCEESSSLFYKCMYSHPDYYQSILTAVETAQNKINKEIEAEVAAMREEGFEINIEDL